MSLLSNPFAEEKPVPDHALYQSSESWGTRMRDALLAPLFYHKHKSFIFIALLCVIGLGMCIIPWLLPALALGIAITLTAIGVVLTALTTLSIYINSYLFGWEDTDNQDEYQEHEIQLIYDAHGNFMGSSSLKYFRGTQEHGFRKVPQLNIQAEDHFKSGYVQGHQLAEQGDKMLEKLKKVYRALRLLNCFGYKIPAWGDEQLIRQFYDVLPEQQKQELQGLIEGHNQWAVAHSKPTIDLGDLIMLHMLPDTHNINDLVLAGGLLSSGCTAGLTKDINGQVMHFRNTDWPSYNLAGRISLLIERHIGDLEHSRIASFPLCIGAEYGENSKGLTLSINVSPGGTVLNQRGKLAFLLYREFLQTCTCVEDVKMKVQYDEYTQPIGPCQLTVSDNQEGAIIRFYQQATFTIEGEEQETLHFLGKNPLYTFSHDIAELSEDNPIIVVGNEGLEQLEDYLTRGNHHDARQRIHNVYQVLLRKDSARGINEAHEALQTPLTLNGESVHTIIKKGQETHFTSSNGYSARFFPIPVGGLTHGAPNQHQASFNRF